MRKFIGYIFAFSSITVSCNLAKDSELVGAWAYCNENGDYVELHFFDGGQALTCPEYSKEGIYLLKYTLIGDSLIFTKDDRIMYSGQVTFIRPSRLEIAVEIEDSITVFFLEKLVADHFYEVGDAGIRLTDYYLSGYEARRERGGCISKVKWPGINLDSLRFEPEEPSP